MLLQSYRLFKLAAENTDGMKFKLFIVLLLEAVSIFFLFLLNKQYGSIYQGIQDYNVDMIYKGIALFSLIAGIIVGVEGFLTFYTNKLAFAIRAGLTIFFTRNIKKTEGIENVEQRIQEDLKNFGEKSCEFWLTVLRSIVKLPLFLGVIMVLTKWWVALIILISVILGTYITKVVATKLIELQAKQESNEAEFRKAIKNRFDMRISFINIHACFLKINKQIKKLCFFQNGLGQTFVLLPFIVLLPLYVTKVVTMGAFMQSVNALSKVIDSLTILIDKRQLIVSVSTCLTRMKELEKVVDNTITIK
jgi:ABC-type uncharacterized transport system fused permease/ATPase subunit